MMEDNRVRFTVAPEQQGTRLDSFLSQQMESLTRSMLQQMIADGYVQVNGKKAAKSAKLKAGDQVDCELPPPKEAAPSTPAKRKARLWECRHVSLSQVMNGAPAMRPTAPMASTLPLCAGERPCTS